MKTSTFVIKGVEITLHQARIISLLIHDKGIDYVADVLGCTPSAVQNSLSMVRLKLNTFSSIGVVAQAIVSDFDFEGNCKGTYLFDGFVPAKAFPWPTPTL